MPKILNIVSIGAGNIAHHLIPALHRIPCRISQVYSRTHNSAAALAHRVNADIITNFEQIDRQADFYIIMVPDDAIKGILSQMPLLNNRQYLVHTSGATGIDVLQNTGQNFGSFYPLQSFRRSVPITLRDVPFLLNGNSDKTIRFLRALARKLADKVSVITDEERLRYHLTAVLLNNFTNHLACISRKLLSDAKLNPDFLNELMDTTFERIKSGDPCASQTGPAIREDEKLMAKHLNLLKDTPHWKNLYNSISESIKIMYHEDDKGMDNR